MTAIAQAAKTEANEQLAEIDNFLTRLTEALEVAARTLDQEQALRWVETAQKWAIALQHNPPPSLDDASLAKLRQIVLEGIVRQRELEHEPYELLDDLLVRAEAIRHLVRDSLDHDLGPMSQLDARGLLTVLNDWLPGITRSEMATLSHRSPRQIQRWLKEGGDPSRELRVAVKLAAILKRSWTPAGVTAWFIRPRRDLEGRSPADVLDDPQYEPELLEAARRGRAQQA